MDSLTLAAGEASLEDNKYYMDNCERIIETRKVVTEELRKMDFMVIDSMTNFIFARSKTIEGKGLQKELKKRGILVRHYDKPLITNYLRITIGNREQMETFLKVIREILKLYS